MQEGVEIEIKFRQNVFGAQAADVGSALLDRVDADVALSGKKQFDGVAGRAFEMRFESE